MKHKYYKCKQPCTKENCQYCDGGLALCTVCGCGEGELPTDCPGFKLSGTTRSLIYGGKLDYKNGRWTAKI